jgi:predicted ester cyclase
VDGERVALFWQFGGTASGEFFGEVKPGTRVQFAGAAEYRVSPAGIVSARHLFDFTGALVTAGVLKVKPT